MSGGHGAREVNNYSRSEGQNVRSRWLELPFDLTSESFSLSAEIKRACQVQTACRVDDKPCSAASAAQGRLSYSGQHCEMIHAGGQLPVGPPLQPCAGTARCANSSLFCVSSRLLPPPFRSSQTRSISRNNSIDMAAKNGCIPSVPIIIKAASVMLQRSTDRFIRRSVSEPPML